MSPVQRVLAALLLAWPPAAAADPCPGPSSFSDVASADIFCTNAEWMRNRGVTTGCTATTYCPGASVTRAQMALFMNRLGVALTPLVLHEEELGGPFTFTSQLGLNACQTASIAAAPHRRYATVIASYTGRSDGPMVSAARITQSPDGGASFEWVNSLVANAEHTDATSANVATNAVVLIPPNVARIFAVQFYRNGGTSHLSSWRCTLVAIVSNANGSTAPYDATAGGE